MKKSTKTATTPAKPAPSPVKKKVEPKATKPVAAPAPKKVTKKVTKPSAPLQPVDAPVSKAPDAVDAITAITAKLDVGFGNTLYIRGEGPGLSWESGVALECVNDDEWSITFANPDGPVVFKFLVNDLTWCIGEDYVVTPGSSLTITPTF